MDKVTRDAIRARCEAATSGPWTAHRYPVEDYNGNHICGDITHGSDKLFIAHARQDIPALLDALDEAEERCVIERATRESVETQFERWKNRAQHGGYEL